MTGPSNRGLWIGLALGVPVMAVGFVGVVIDATFTHPAELARWVVGAAVVHDLVVVPPTLLVATFLRRRLPARLWPVLRWALVTSVVLTAFALPFARGYGRDDTIPSLLDRNYALGLLAYLVAVWIVAAVVVLSTARGGERR